MTDSHSQITIREQTVEAVRELAEASGLRPGRVLVVGVSTSEVAGRRIGTAGALEVARELLSGFERVRAEYGFDIVFQCCEHLNRALVMERRVLERLGLTEVAAVPVPTAGGSMAAAAYQSMEEPCLAEAVQADAGIDIGETLIGMHLRRVAVPYRLGRRYIGEARVTAATTRPKLIGGERAVYRLELEQQGNTTACD
ncbi:TIGR01440 family protein [Paenibacillus sp. JX-17]|uniref:UPF0340 protein Q5741_08775 n=1 Tax=Paenibacillus lacisoli TaxID=3064525 RepID=A0ABT9CB82_9BACL|nr:TIGR01440 family protein [Paenibacillus sp. JX-17]MDO7906511.1 TIGR01440 family protein [Paenibacillus sp. JX-17]